MTMTSKMFSYEMLYHFLLNKKKRFVQYGDACCAHPSEECSAEQVLVSLCQNLYCTLREFWWALASKCSAEHSLVVIWWDACCRKSSHASVLHFWQLEIMTTWEQGTLISKKWIFFWLSFNFRVWIKRLRNEIRTNINICWHNREFHLFYISMLFSQLNQYIDKKNSWLSFCDRYFIFNH